MFLKVLKSSIIETKPKEHARKIGVSSELDIALNIYFRRSFYKDLDNSLVANTYFINK